MTPQKLQAIKKRVAAAAPAPWEYQGDGHIFDAADSVEIKLTSLGRPIAPTATFIEHAREDVPALVAALETAASDAQWWKGQAEETLRERNQAREACDDAHQSALEWAAEVGRLAKTRAELRQELDAARDEVGRLRYLLGCARTVIEDGFMDGEWATIVQTQKELLPQRAVVESKFAESVLNAIVKALGKKGET